MGKITSAPANRFFPLVTGSKRNIAKATKNNLFGASSTATATRVKKDEPGLRQLKKDNPTTSWRELKDDQAALKELKEKQKIAARLRNVEASTRLSPADKAKEMLADAMLMVGSKRVAKPTSAEKAGLQESMSHAFAAAPAAASATMIEARNTAQFGITLTKFIYGGGRESAPAEVRALVSNLLAAVRKKYNYDGYTDKDILYETIDHLAHLTFGKLAEFIAENPVYTGVDRIIAYVKSTERPLLNS